MYNYTDNLIYSEKFITFDSPIFTLPSIKSEIYNTSYNNNIGGYINKIPFIGIVSSDDSATGTTVISIFLLKDNRIIKILKFTFLNTYYGYEYSGNLFFNDYNDIYVKDSNFKWLLNNLGSFTASANPIYNSHQLYFFIPYYSTFLYYHCYSLDFNNYLNLIDIGTFTPAVDSPYYGALSLNSLYVGFSYISQINGYYQKANSYLDLPNPSNAGSLVSFKNKYLLDPVNGNSFDIGNNNLTLLPATDTNSIGYLVKNIIYITGTNDRFTFGTNRIILDNYTDTIYHVINNSFYNLANPPSYTYQIATDAYNNIYYLSGFNIIHVNLSPVGLTDPVINPRQIFEFSGVGCENFQKICKI